MLQNIGSKLEIVAIILSTLTKSFAEPFYPFESQRRVYSTFDQKILIFK